MVYFDMKLASFFSAVVILLLIGCRETKIIAVIDGDVSIGPVLKVDLNMFGRQEKEVNSPDYIPWPIEEAEIVEKTFDDITISFEPVGNDATSLRSEWYKAGVLTPTLAKLVNDGMVTSSSEDGVSIQMTISGLPEGVHSLLTYHNTFANPDTNTFAPINIFVDGILAVKNLIPTNRADSDYRAASSYLALSVSQGEDVTILFETDTTIDSTWKNISICGFELNTSDAKLRASEPIPKNADEHVNADDGTLLLTWKGADNAVYHEVYLGTDKSEVEKADLNHDLFLGSQQNTSLRLSDIYSMETYYWRVDEVEADGIRTKGNVWKFRPRQLAFEGAEGHGRFARGGRGGAVVYVTNLNDDGAGSLRHAVTNEIGPRIIVFEVSGIIDLEAPLTISGSHITIAGQTAPGRGICIRKAPLRMNGGEDVVISNLRLRLGSGATYEGMGMAGADHSIMDHCSISWTINEAFSSVLAMNITLQRTLISEPLNIITHAEYPEGTAIGYGASLSGEVGSYHHNLIAHSRTRNWNLDGRLDANGEFAGRMNIYNNVVYNWQTGTTEGGAHQVNFVGNYYKPGPATANDLAMNVHFEDFPGTRQYYFEGNVMPGIFNESNQNVGKAYSGTPIEYSPWVTSPFDFLDVEPKTATAAYKNVLSDVGCSAPFNDSHDLRIISETISGEARFSGSISGLPGIIDHEDDVDSIDSYYTFEKRPANYDSDKDGLPDFWEKLLGLNLKSNEGDFTETNSDPDMDGFTALDDYLRFTAGPHYFTTIDEELNIDLQKLFRGYTNNPAFTILKTLGGVGVIRGASVLFTASKCGLGSITLQVKDADGDTMTWTVNIFVDTNPSGECESNN